MKKELSANLEMVTCEVCGRTILKGERVEPYLVPDGSRRLVCELCTRRAEQAGWLRESAHADTPTPFPRAEPRRSLLTRLRRRREENTPAPGAEQTPGAGAWEEDVYAPAHPAEPAAGIEPAAREPAEAGREAGEYAEPPVADVPSHEEPIAHEHDLADEDAGAVYEEAPVGYVDAAVPGRRPAYEGTAERVADERARRRERRSRRRLRDPRHVRAVPTNADVKVERALELFNASEFQRTTAGLMRTLGEPWVTALPLDSPSEVTIVVAWELSWYQYRVDLGDSNEAVALVDKGQELKELDGSLREWNATATADGELEPRAPAA
jgi:hypothetical protein